MLLTIPYSGSIKRIVICLLLLLNSSISKAEDPISILLTASGGISYTGANTYITLGGAYRKHMVYVGPKLAMSRSYFPGKMMWGGNIGYSFSIIEKERWDSFFNADYQLTQYRNAGALKMSNIHEITGGLGLNYFPIPHRLSIGLTIGSGVYMQKSYNQYNVNRKYISGMMQQIRLGITYKISNK
jgi:hypothetical protein